MRGWRTVPLGEVAEFLRGITFKPDDVVPVGTAGSVACMRTKNVQETLDVSDEWAIDERFVRRTDQLLAPGDVLVSSANSWNLVGKCCWIPSLPWRATFGGFVSVLRSRRDRLDPRFLYRWFSSGPVQARVRSFGNQTTSISNLSAERCLALHLPLPSLPEQCHIAEILDRAEALRAKRRSALEEIDGLTQAIFLEMFGDPATNPRGWPTATIGQIGEVVTGNTPPRDNPDLYGTAIEWVKSDNLNTPYTYVTKATEGLSDAGKAVCRTAPAGSILVTCIAGTPACIGNAAVADREVAFNQQINALVPGTSDSLFLYVQIVLLKRLIQLASTGGMKGMVNKSRFERIPMIHPPIPVQRAFAHRAAAVGRLEAAHRASLAHLDALFASLQHRAFRGEL